MSTQPSTGGFVKWQPLDIAYTDPLDNTLIARAQSALTGTELGVCPPLEIEQARDVLAWFDPKY